MYRAIFIIAIVGILSLTSSANGQMIEIQTPCTFSNRSFSNVGTFLTAQPDIAINSPYTKVINVTDKNGILANFSDVKGFYLSSRILRYFPMNIDVYFPNLKAVYICCSGLRFMTQENLEPFTDLISLTLSSNELTFIVPNLFKFNSKLLYLDLSYNPLLYIEPTAFSSLMLLSYLSIQNNFCSDLRSAQNYQQVGVLLANLTMTKCADVSNQQISYAIKQYSALGGGNSSCNDNSCEEKLKVRDEQIWNLEQELSKCQGASGNCSNDNGTDLALQNELNNCRNYSAELEGYIFEMSADFYNFSLQFDQCHDDLQNVTIQNEILQMINEKMEQEINWLGSDLRNVSSLVSYLTWELENCRKNSSGFDYGNETTTFRPNNSTGMDFGNSTTTNRPHGSSEENSVEDDSESNESDYDVGTDSSEEHGKHHRKCRHGKMIEILVKKFKKIKIVKSSK